MGLYALQLSGQIWSGSCFQKSLPNEDNISTLRIVMSKSHQTKTDKEFLQFIESLGISYEIIEIGSSLKLCALSDDSADIYPRFGPTSEWEYCCRPCNSFKFAEVLYLKCLIAKS